MTRFAVACLPIVSLFLVQIVVSQSTPAGQKSVSLNASVEPKTPAASLPRTKPSTIAPDTPVIMINGLCDDAPANKTTASKCKIIITRAEFERVIDAVQPGMPKRVRREFALDYVDFLRMAKKAEQMGLDKGSNYEEQIRLARIKVLSQDLKRAVQAETSQISERDIEEYYYDNATKFEKAVIDRIYIPKTQQQSFVSDKLSGVDRQERLQESEQVMKEAADNIHARAVAGEEFMKLQVHAYQVAGMKTSAPPTSLAIRRISLPANQGSVMDLKPGDVSPVLVDPNGYFVYRIESKDSLPLDQVREEIRATLRSQRMQDEMLSIQNSATPTLDESYFGR
jgi:hypothetical protein